MGRKVMYDWMKRGMTFCLWFFLLGSVVIYGQDRSDNIEALFEAVGLEEGKWVADIGSREGYFTLRMAPRVGETGHVFAVDIDAEALEELHENLRDQDIQNVTPVFSVYDNPLLPAHSLDAVLIRNTYHEFTEPLSMLRHVKQALKPGGRLVIVEPISNRLEDASRERQAESHDISMNYVKEDLEQAGFVIIDEVDQFSRGRRGSHYWLLVALPASD